MRDPLTKEQREDFIKYFVEKFHDNYEQALRSGALSEEVGQYGDHTVARTVLVITAEGMHPLSKTGKETLQNLRQFI